MLPHCEECLETVSVDMRREMGCGFEAPLENPSATWKHPGMTERLKHCPVYTTDLPDVLDVALATVSCGQGGLTTLPVLCAGKNPPRSLIAGCQILNGAIGQQTSWKADPENKKKTP